MIETPAASSSAIETLVARRTVNSSQSTVEAEKNDVAWPTWTGEPPERATWTGSTA